MHFTIFTGGVLRPGKAVSDAIKKANSIIAADIGAKTALSFNCIPQIILGDLDSLDEKTIDWLKTKNCKFIISPAEKNETDTELAISFAVANKATEISVLGGTEGNRIDHILANIFLIASFNIPIRFINGSTTAWVEKGPKEVLIKGNTNDLLSLIPLTFEVKNITTDNLQYPLVNGSLSFGKSRGISNVFMKESVKVKFSEGLLFFVHTIKNELIENSSLTK